MDYLYILWLIFTYMDYLKIINNTIQYNTIQYKYGSKYTINAQTSTTWKVNTITLVEEMKNKQGRGSKKHQSYITLAI
jgi:hypothetical protein